MGIGRLYDRSWCGHSIGHRPLGNGGLVFNFFFLPRSGWSESRKRGGLLGPYIQNETPPLQSSFLATVPA